MMWILPKPIISAFAPGTEALISDSDEFSRVAEQSLMWRSKPSPLRTWSQRWKRENWIKHLSGRTLRRSRQNNFTDWWTSSLAGTRANRSVPQENETPKTQEDSGRFCVEQFELFDQVESSLKTSKDTYRLDSPRYSAIWTKMVTMQRGEYSARLKSARATRESESSSWPTPDASVEKFRLGGNSQQSRSLEAMGRRGELSPPDLVNRNSTGKNQEQWPTPNASDAKGQNLPHDIGRNYLRTDALPKPTYCQKLNPNWVEQLMGVPVGWTQLPIEWTDFDSSETELSRLQQQKHGSN